MPSLLTLTAPDGSLSAVAGWRRASEGQLFLERYLDQPIEAAIAAHSVTSVRRAQIAEVGNFACAHVDVARVFVAKLPHFLLRQQLSWISFTATRRIRAILEQMCAGCVDLGPADAACVTDGADDWGRYYECEPRVLAGYLPTAHDIPALRANHVD